MALKEQLAKQTGQSIVTAGLSMGFGVVSFFLLSKLLVRDEIAMMGVASGFLAMIGPLLISPDIALFRNYAELKKEFNRYISAFLLFWLARTIVIMGVVAVAGYVLFAARGDFLYVYILGAGLIMNLSMFQASIQEIFYVEFRQRDILSLNLIYYVLFFLFLAAVYFRPELQVYLLIWLSLSLLFSIAWFLRLSRALRFRFILDIKGSGKIIRGILSKVAIWTHLSSSVVQVIYRADVFFLGLFALAFVTGNYTIALMFSSLFIFVPQILQKMCMTGLTRTTTRENDLKVVNAFVKYAFLISLIQIVAYWFLGDYLLSFIDAQNHAAIFELGWYIILGVNVFNVARPIHSYCVARGDLTKLFFLVFLPTGIIALASYALAAYWFGAVATAQANILVYAVMSLLHVGFAFAFLGYRLPTQWITAEERALLKKVRMRITL